MSKEAALRAMREARFSERSTGPTAGAVAAKKTARPAAKPVVRTEPVARAGADAAPSTEALCGHRSMNGRTCTRELGHAAKNHRYS